MTLAAVGCRQCTYTWRCTHILTHTPLSVPLPTFIASFVTTQHNFRSRFAATLYRACVSSLREPLGCSYYFTFVFKSVCSSFCFWLHLVSCFAVRCRTFHSCRPVSVPRRTMIVGSIRCYQIVTSRKCVPCVTRCDFSPAAPFSQGRGESRTRSVCRSHSAPGCIALECVGEKQSHCENTFCAKGTKYDSTTWPYLYSCNCVYTDTYISIRVPWRALK